MLHNNERGIDMETFFELYQPDQNVPADAEELQRVEKAKATKAEADAKGQTFEQKFEWVDKVDGKEVYRLVASDPVQDTWIEIALDRAAQWLDGIEYPLILGLEWKFPGVNPHGKHSELEMAFDQRLERLERIAKKCASPNQEILKHFFENLSVLVELKKGVQEYGETIRLYSFAAMVCPEPEVSEALENEANRWAADAKKDPDVRALDQILTVMEQVAGIQAGPLDPEAIERCKQYFPDLPLTEETPIGRNVYDIEPEIYLADVEPDEERFADIAKHILQQEAMADPKYLQKLRDQAEGLIENREELSSEIPEESLKACKRRCAVAQMLTDFFAPLEKIGEPRTPGGFDRGTQIIVDGKQIKQWMQENYEESDDDEKSEIEFEEWYQKNLDLWSVWLVSSALENQKRVLVYATSSDGSINTWPTEIKENITVPWKYSNLGNDEIWVANNLLERAYKAYKTQGAQYPLILGLEQKYPGVNPHEKFSRVEMGFAQRIDWLKIVRQMCDGDTRDVLDAILDSDCIDSLLEEMSDYCWQIRMIRDAAKLCKDTSLKEKLEKFANTLEEDASQIEPAVHKLDKILTVAEQVAGIQEGSLDEKGVGILQWYGVELPDEIPTGRQVQHIIPASLEILVPDDACVDHVLTQELLAQAIHQNPENLSESLDKVLGADVIERKQSMVECKHRCVTAATRTVLPILFGPCERRMGPTRTIDKFNRGTLIIADDETISEWMQALFENRKDDISELLYDSKISGEALLGKWYDENLDEMSVMRLVDTLKRDGQVLAYVPRSDLKVPTKSILIKKADAAPEGNWSNKVNAPEGKVYRQTDPIKTLNTTHTDSRIDAGRRLQANKQVMEERRLEPGSAFTTDLFLGPDSQEKEDSIDNLDPDSQENENSIDKLVVVLDNFLKSECCTNRSAIISDCICILAADEEEIEDILNPTQLQDARLRAKKEYVQHRNDPQWLGEQIYKGQKKLLNWIDDMMEEKTLVNPTVRNEVFPMINFAARAMFEGLQEAANHPEVLTGYIRAAKEAGEDANEIKDRVRNMFALCDVLHRADAFRAMMSRPLPPPNEKDVVSNGLAALLEERWILQEYQWNPTVPFSQSCPPAQLIQDIQNELKKEPVKGGIDDYARQLAYGWKNWKAGAKYVLEGNFAQGATVSIQTIDRKKEDWTLDENGKGKIDSYLVTEYIVPNNVSVEYSEEFKQVVQDATNQPHRQLTQSANETNRTETTVSAPPAQKTKKAQNDGCVLQ